MRYFTLIIIAVAAYQPVAGQGGRRPGPGMRAALRAMQPMRVPVAATAPAGSGGAGGVPVRRPALWGTQVGRTTYDLQTNRATTNRIAAWGGRVSMLWTQSCDTTGGPTVFSDRGVGFNERQGSSWLHDSSGTCPATYGIATRRTGWPELLVVDSQEVAVMQTGYAIAVQRRGVGGGWGITTDLPFTLSTGSTGAMGANGSCPRAVASGRTIHLIYCSNGSVTDPQQPSGVINPMLYARSTDGGMTWDRQNVLLPGLDSTNFRMIGGDAYALAANGATVAIVAGGFGDQVRLWKSVDGGQTFQARVIHRITAADTIRLVGYQDTAAAYTSDASHSVAVDDNGVVHWWSGQQMILISGASTGLYEPTGQYFPQVANGLWYWSDALPAGARPSVIAEPANAGSVSPGNPPQRQQYGVIGTASMAAGSVDSAGNAYVIFVAQRVDTSAVLGAQWTEYRELLVLKGFNQGGGVLQWSRPINISHDLRGVAGGSSAAGEENVYPVTVRRVGADNLLHYTWMSDDDPGTALQPAGTPRPVHMSRIMYDALDLTPGVIPFRLGPAGSGEERQEVLAAVLAPNPATEVAELRLELARAGEVTVTLRDVMGRVVTRPVTRQFGAGSQRLVLPVQPLGPGVYLCEVRGAGGSVVRRLVRQ